MSKKSSFRRHFGVRHGQREEGPLKSGGHHFQYSYWSLWRQLDSKKSLLLICKVWKVFVNALTARDKYSLRNRKNLMQPTHGRLSQKQEKLSWFFFPFLKCTLNFKHFPKKGDTHSSKYFRNCGLRKTCLNKCLKNTISEDTSAIRMVNGNKHCWNLEGKTFSIVIDHSEGY